MNNTNLFLVSVVLAVAAPAADIETRETPAAVLSRVYIYIMYTKAKANTLI